MFPTDTRGSAALREVTASTEALERRLVPELTLGQREMISVRLRELAREIIEVGEPDALVARYRAIEDHLSRLDDTQFMPLRERLYSGNYAPADFHAALGAMPQYEWDAWTRRLFDLHVVPPTTVLLTSEMVPYITTHVIQVMEVATELGPDDVLYDLGSGLGFVSILASWLSGARSVGVEIEPSFVERARTRALAVGVADKVSFIQQDLRETDYSDATALYLFYPCRGPLLDEIIARFEPAARKRAMRIYSLGLSGPPLIAQDWIKVRGQSPSGLLALESVVGSAPKKRGSGAKKRTSKRSAAE